MGVKQGCPLSMLFFSIVINPVIEAIDTTFGKGYTMNDINIGVLAYADDLAENDTTLQLMIDAADTVAGWARLKFRPNKCTTQMDRKYTIALKHMGIQNSQIDRTIRAMALSNIEESAKIW